MEQSNLSRWKDCMRRAEEGKELVLGFFGGSITQGSLASKQENTYVYQVYSWWRKTFPQAKFRYVNAGVGGTTSHYGVSRVVTDLLQYQPDIVIVDFSVNDEANAFFQETYEGLVRRILAWQSRPAVLLLNNVYYSTGMNAQKYHNEVGAWYQIPFVSIKDTIYQRMKRGEFSVEELSPDGLHPNDNGHHLVAEEIIKFLEQIKENMAEPEEEVFLPEPMTENAYQNAKRFNALDSNDFFHNGWIGRKGGDSISFTVEASCIAVQYRKTIKKPAMRAELILDGDNAHPILLDGNFDEDWGDSLYLEPIVHHGEKREYQVEIRILPEEKENATPFYLLSLIVA